MMLVCVACCTHYILCDSERGEREEECEILEGLFLPPTPKGENLSWCAGKYSCSCMQLLLLLGFV